MAEAGGEMVSFTEAPTPGIGERPPITEAAPFVAQVEQLVTRVRNAKLRDHGQVLENLQQWIDRAMAGQIDIARDGAQIIGTLENNVDEMIRARTLMRRVVAPLGGLGILYAGLWAVTVWAAAANILFLGTPLAIAVTAVVFGVAGSSFRVLLRTITFQYEQTDRGALVLLGLARPLVGGVLALAVFAILGAGTISLPIVSEQETTTFASFLTLPGAGGSGAAVGQLAMFGIAFVAGLLEGIFIPAAGRGVSRVADRVARATGQ